MASVGLGVGAAALVGWLVGSLTERGQARAASQVVVAVVACAATFLIGGKLGVSVV